MRYGHLAGKVVLCLSLCAPGFARAEFTVPQVVDAVDPTKVPAGMPKCLDPGGCHGPGAARPSLEISQFFDFDAAANNDLVSSQHNITYTLAADVLTQQCTVCHPANPDPAAPGKHYYVKTGNLLRYPDGIGATAADTLLPKAASVSAYENFCLSCHDGVTSGGADTFSGALPAQQVGPSSRTNPANQQGGPTWVVPAVPPWGATPYFASYRTNGHGAANSLISGGPMAKTCISGGFPEGCHSSHGSKNRFLVSDIDYTYTKPATAPPPSWPETDAGGPNLDKAWEFATGLCYDCHSDIGGASVASSFHAWWANSTVLHDDSPLKGVGAAGARDGMVGWTAYGAGNMNIATSPALAGVLPFYGDPAGAANGIHQRTYATALTPANFVHCLTCHDPHGTGPNTEPGMLRRFDNTMTYGSPLCGQCHVE